MKAIKISDELWKELMTIKLENGHKSMDEVIRNHYYKPAKKVKGFRK